MKEAFDRWETESAKVWARTDLSLEEKHAEEERLFRAVEQSDEAIQNPDPEIMEQRRMFINYNKLQGFYGMNWRYSPEFKQAYRIFKEEGLADNPIRLAHTPWSA